MSTRLIMPISMDNLRMRSQLPHAKELKKARRALFGKPEPEETRNFWAFELRKHQDISSEKYSFDFEAGVPIVGPNSKYEYTSCELMQVPEKERPALKEIDLDDADLGYFKPVEIIANCLRDEKAPPDLEHKNAEKIPLKGKKQASITEYMSHRKRNANSEKLETVIPTKVIKKVDVNS